MTYDLRFPGICFISRFWQVGEISSLHCTVNVYTIRFLSRSVAFSDDLID